MTLDFRKTEWVEHGKPIEEDDRVVWIELPPDPGGVWRCCTWVDVDGRPRSVRVTPLDRVSTIEDIH